MTQQDRRKFLKTAGAISAGGLLAARSTAAEVTPAGNTTAPGSEITRQTFLEAEKLTGVPYTDSERDVMIGSIKEQILWAKQLQDLNLRNSD